MQGYSCAAVHQWLDEIELEIETVLAVHLPDAEEDYFGSRRHLEVAKAKVRAIRRVHEG